MVTLAPGAGSRGSSNENGSAKRLGRSFDRDFLPLSQLCGSVADEGEAATDPLAERRQDQPAGLTVPLGEAGVEQPGLEASGAEDAEGAEGAAPPEVEQLGG